MSTDPQREPVQGPLAILPAHARDMATEKLAAWPKRKIEQGEEVETSGGCYTLWNGVAIVSIVGPLAQYGGWWYDGHESVQSRIMHALLDPRAGAVVLEINSPGGVVSGCFDAVRAVRAAVIASGKSVDVWVGDSCYSAGYAWACVGKRIHLPDTGGVGSVGVIGTIVSFDRMNKEIGIDVYLVRSGSQKADTHPEGPIDPAAIAREQVEVDRLARIFAEVVAESRALSVDDILARQGGTVHGPEAVAAGYADSITTFGAVLEMAEAAGRERRMQQIAGRLGLAATASETEINNEITKREVDALAKVADAERRAKDAEAGRDALAACAFDLAVRCGARTVGQREAELALLKAAPTAAGHALASSPATIPASKVEPADGPKAGTEYKTPAKTWTTYPTDAAEQVALFEQDANLFYKLRADARKG
jgi:ClpP class serine protease